MSQRISKIAKQVLKEYSKKDNIEYNNIAYGDLDFLHEIFNRSGHKLKIPHPLNRTEYVLNALDRESKYKDAIFIKEYFRSFKGLARMFTLKEGDNK